MRHILRSLSCCWPIRRQMNAVRHELHLVTRAPYTNLRIQLTSVCAALDLQRGTEARRPTKLLHGRRLLQPTWLAGSVAMGVACHRSACLLRVIRRSCELFHARMPFVDMSDDARSLSRHVLLLPLDGESIVTWANTRPAVLQFRPDTCSRE